MPSNNAWLTVDQTAKALGRSGDTIRRMIRAGRLEAFKVGDGQTSRIQIPQRAVRDLLEASRVRPAARPSTRTTGRRIVVDSAGDIFAVPEHAA